MALDFKQTNARQRRPLVAAFIVAAILQVALAPQISVFGGRINFMLALTVTAAVGGDSRTMVYAGFAAGLLYDLTSSVPIGLMALLLTILGYTIAMMSRGIVAGMSMDTLRLVGVGVFIVNMVYGVFLFFMGTETNLLFALGVHGLASSILTFVACLPFLMMGGQSGSSRGFSAAGTRSHGTRFKGLH